MKINKLLIGLGLCLMTAHVSASDGRSPDDIMSHYLSSKEASTTSSSSTTVSALAFTTTEECLADTISPTGPAVVFNNTTELATRFPLAKTLDAIVNTSGTPVSSSSSIDLMQSMLDSHNLSQQTNPDSALTMPVDVRTGEANLSAINLVQNGGMRPVALFNRFDLADAGGAHCGEYRIIYAMDAAAAAASGRFFIIFEAQYPNPEPSKNIDGCLSVADFWSSLDDPLLTETQKADLLEQFYYTGLVHNGVSLPPVVNFTNYSATKGQVRTNNFINFNKWQLREFKTAVSGGISVFSPEPVKDNPLTELYNEFAFFDGDQVAFQNLRAAFQGDFLQIFLGNLTAPDNSPVTDPLDLVNGITMGNDNRYNEFQSDSQGFTDRPSPDANFAVQITTAVSGLGLDSSHIVNRSGALTCGGCHQFSNGVPISSTVNWPFSLGFVHVDEFGGLSSALTSSFLPKRAELLQEFVCNRIEPPRTKPSDLSWLVPVVNLILF